MALPQTILLRACLMACLWGSVQAAEDARLAAAIPSIETTVRQSGAEVGIAFETLDGRSSLFMRADEPFHAASTMKVPVLIELYRQVHAGKLRLDDTLVLKNEFPSLVDGSPFSLNAADDSEASLYAAIGSRRTLAQLSDLMITVSSNFAANLLIGKLGVGNIRNTVHALGADGMQVRRRLEDSKAFEQGINNTTTARGLWRLMQAIARGEAVDSGSSRQMREILERQTFNDGIPAGLPPGTRVAHKTGDITRIQHDGAIVYAPRPFVLVILTRGISEQKQSYALIADITRQLYAATQ
ncbi:MAG TPA: serine hydrolase [Chloroflexota bacterium]|nr:serine hydrolase [Chloroflexota bacterium]